MSVRQIYDVYDDGKLIEHAVTREFILKMLGKESLNITQYCERGWKVDGRYTFKHLGDAVDVKNILPNMNDNFSYEWIKMQSMFRNVIWVKEGGKKLTV